MACHTVGTPCTFPVSLCLTCAFKIMSCTLGIMKYKCFQHKGALTKLAFTFPSGRHSPCPKLPSDNLFPMTIMLAYPTLRMLTVGAKVIYQDDLLQQLKRGPVDDAGDSPPDDGQSFIHEYEDDADGWEPGRVCLLKTPVRHHSFFCNTLFFNYLNTVVQASSSVHMVSY